ncbi:MAG: PIN domain-containing protein [Bacteroidaceae bacterium]|nr:PIN domain-containing protein [Bacteroidaceae bacterium]
MRGYLLDTDTWIEYFHRRCGVEAKINALPANEIFASEVTIAELTYGALHSKAIERHLKETQMIEDAFTVLPISDALRDYAEIRHATASQGLGVADFDILIGATARHYGLTVVTHNTKHFGRMPGVQIVDWIEVSK